VVEKPSTFTFPYPCSANHQVLSLIFSNTSLKGSDQMKAILFPGDKQSQLVTLPDPTPGPGEVIIQIKVAAVCGTDIHYWHETAQARGERQDIVPGHEGCGVVVAAGPGVEHLKVGDTVVAYHHVGCGYCGWCYQGAPMYCANKRVMGRHINGSDGEFVAIPARATFKLPAGFTMEDGALLACNISTAFSALKKAGANSFSRLAIFGLGPVGLSAVMLAKAMGAEVAGIDLRSERLELGRKLGADIVFSATDPTTPQALTEWTRNQGLTAALDCSGSTAAQLAALNALGPQGTLVQVGTATRPLPLQTNDLLGREIRIIGNSVYKAFEFEEMTDFILRKKLNISTLIDKRMPVTQIQQALELAETGQYGKILLGWEDE
jgi:2-desacetyl-2-hydroxyethyl bacteriochlorophyllide A dehydrogenase